MKLFVWEKEFDLPSVDYKCLQMWAYLKFCGLDVTTCYSSPSAIFKDSLPVFQDEKRIENLKDLANYLKEKNISPKNVENENMLDTLAITAMLNKDLQLALTYQWWVEESNYEEIIRPCFSKKCSFPTNYFVPGQMHRSAIEYMNFYMPDWKKNTYLKLWLNDSVAKLFERLSAKLNDNPYFCGQHPGQLDAVIFGYLAVIEKVNFRSYNGIQLKLQEHDNLKTYINRVLGTYFADFANEKAKPKSEPHELNDSCSWWDIIFFSMFSSVAMFSFALLNGALRKSIESEKYEDEDEEDDYSNENNMPLPLKSRDLFI